jgi:hypothetical protein
VLFIDTLARPMAVDEAAFSPLESALLEAQTWEPLVADAIQRALDEVPVDLKLEPLGVFAMSQVTPPLGPDGGVPQLGPGVRPSQLPGHTQSQPPPGQLPPGSFPPGPPR